MLLVTIALSCMYLAVYFYNINQLENNFLKAKQHGDIPSMLFYAKSLANRNNLQYQKKHHTLLQIPPLLEGSRKAKSEGRLIQSFLEAVRANELYPNKPAQSLIASSGKLLLPLLRVQAKLALVATLTKENEASITLVDNWLHRSVTDWKLVRVNKFVEEQNIKIKLLTECVSILEHQIRILPKENNLLMGWLVNIKQNLYSAKYMKNSLIAYAIAQSNFKLKNSQSLLIKESNKLLSLVRPSVALIGVRPVFSQEAKKLMPFINVIENLAEGESNDTKEKMQRWVDTAKNIVLMPTNIMDYIEHSKNNIAMIAQLEQFYNDQTKFAKQQLGQQKLIPDELIPLLDKLEQEKSIIYYAEVVL